MPLRVESNILWKHLGVAFSLRDTLRRYERRGCRGGLGGDSPSAPASDRTLAAVGGGERANGSRMGPTSTSGQRPTRRGLPGLYRPLPGPHFGVESPHYGFLYIHPKIICTDKKCGVACGPAGPEHIPYGAQPPPEANASSVAACGVCTERLRRVPGSLEQTAGEVEWATPLPDVSLQERRVHGGGTPAEL
ncbi:unnamed protein product [Caenorhabditis brenneri]